MSTENNKYLDLFFTRNFRKAGGLFLGITMNFPRKILREESLGTLDTYDYVAVKVGFVIFTMNIHFRYNFNK